MPEPIWTKGRVDRDERIAGFLAGDDVALDAALFHYDLRASAAHVRALAGIGILSAAERDAVVNELARLGEGFDDGTFVLDTRFEDGHSAIEWWLTEKLGETGRKVHTGRSRNDQVLVATRLYLKDALTGIAADSRDCARVCLDRAAASTGVPMPGYTHLQRAMVTTVGAWFAGYAEAFIDDARLARDTLRWIDANPLGTAAGFGVNLPLDRDATTRELGFSRQQVSPQYAQLSRGKYELQAVMALAQALLDVRRLAWDLSLFATQEFGFATLPDRYTTGSSIMPNKRNPDVIELMRAAVAQAQGAIGELMAIVALPGGYHRDLQGTKEPVLRTMARGRLALSLTPALLADLVFDEDRMRAALEPSMYATDRAVDLARQDVPFRDAYRRVAAELDSLGAQDPAESIAARVSPGGAGNLQLEVLERRYAALDSSST